MRQDKGLRLAVGSFIEEQVNKVQILQCASQEFNLSVCTHTCVVLSLLMVFYSM